MSNNLLPSLRRAWDSPTLTTLTGFVVRIGGMLLLTPFLVTKFSAAEIAAWYLFSNVIVLCYLVDLGFGPTFSRLVAFATTGATDLRDFAPGSTPQADGQPSWEVMGRLYVTMRTIYWALTLALLLVLAVLGTWAVHRTIGALANPAAGYWAWAVVVFTATASFAGSRYNNWMTGLYRVALVNRWNSGWSALGVVLATVALAGNGGLMAVVLAYQLPQVLAALTMRQLLRQESAGRYLTFKGFGIDAEIMRAAWPVAWRSAILIAGSTGVAQGISLIYAQLGNAQELADFLFTQKLLVSIAAFSQAPFYAHLPRYAALRARGQLEQLAGETARAIRWSLAFFALAAVGVGVLGNLALQMIHANARLMDGVFWAGWSLVYFLERHQAMHAQIYCTTNRIPFYFPVCLSGVANLAMSYAMVPLMGPWAFVLAHGISNLAFNNWWNVKMSLSSLPAGSRRIFVSPVLLPGLILLLFGAAQLGS